MPEMAGSTQRQNGINPAIMQALASPYANDQVRSIATALMQRQFDQEDMRQKMAMQNADPYRQLQMQAAQQGLEKGQLEIEALRNPQPKVTDTQRNLMWRAEQAGIMPGTPEYQRFMATGGDKGINVNVDTGTIPAGYQAVRDAEGRVLRYEAIPGGPADRSGSEAASADSRATSSDIVTNAAARAREAMAAPGMPTTGTLGKIMSGLPESNAAEVRRQVEVLKSNAKIENLQAMRAASPTGGALGAVSDSENAMLAAKAGALDPDSPNFARDLEDYERSLLRVIHGREQGDLIFEESRAAKPLTDMSDEELEAIVNGNR